MIQKIAERNLRLLVIMLLPGCFAVVECLPAYSATSIFVPNNDVYLVEPGFDAYQLDQSSDLDIAGVISRKSHLVLFSSCILKTANEVLAPFQIPLLQTGRGLGGCGEN